jgi:hypothetical protein
VAVDRPARLDESVPEGSEQLAGLGPRRLTDREAVVEQVETGGEDPCVKLVEIDDETLSVELLRFEHHLEFPRVTVEGDARPGVSPHVVGEVDVDGG